MDTLNGHRRLRALIVGGALAVALAMPLAVSADTTGGSVIQPAFSRGATITLDAVHLKSKLIATVDISFTCDPLLVYDWETGTYTTTTAGQVEDATAVIVQGSGRSIASASGDAFGGDVAVRWKPCQLVDHPRRRRRRRPGSREPRPRARGSRSPMPRSSPGTTRAPAPSPSSSASSRGRSGALA